MAEELHGRPCILLLLSIPEKGARLGGAGVIEAEFTGAVEERKAASLCLPLGKHDGKSETWCLESVFSAWLKDSTKGTGGPRHFVMDVRSLAPVKHCQQEIVGTAGETELSTKLRRGVVCEVLLFPLCGLCNILLSC